MDFDGFTSIQFALQSALLGIDTSSMANLEAVKSNRLFDPSRLKPSPLLGQPILPGPWGCSPLGGATKLNPESGSLDIVSAMYAQHAFRLQLQQLTTPLLAPALTVNPPAPQLKPASLPTSDTEPALATPEVQVSSETLLHPKQSLSSCCICDEQFESQTSATTHLLSKNHQRRVFEQEQCAAIVTGVPHEAAMAILEALFQDFTLPPGAATLIPALADPRSQEGLAKVLEPYRPAGEYWHVVLASPEEAQQAAQISEVAFFHHRLRVHLAVQPQHCPTCDVTVQSTPQLEDHRHSHRHQELFRQHAARCGLSLVGLPLEVGRRELAVLLDACEIVEEGYTAEVVTKKDGTQSQTVHLVFASEADADEAYDRCKVGDPLLGPALRLLRPCGPKRDDAEVALLIAKKAGEVQQLVSGMLRAHHIKDIRAVSPSIFTRIYNSYVLARPAVLPTLIPRHRFLKEFEQAAQNGIVSLDSALAILQPLGLEFPFALPESIALWLCERVMRYSGNSQMVPITRSTFIRI
eukprot:EG_transcript_9629